MDIISHALWTNLVFKESPTVQRGLIVLFGIMPDIISFSFITVKNFIIKTLTYKDPPLSVFPKKVFIAYKITHSLIVWGIIYLILKVFLVEWWAFVFLGWGFHIILDIFTHGKNYFSTPILWPFSRFKLYGISWSNKWFMAFNYLVITAAYLLFYF